MSEQVFSSLSQMVIDGDMESAVEEVKRVLGEGLSPQIVMEGHLIPAMREVGRLFEENEYFVPELLISARAMQESMKILNPLLKSSGVDKIGRIAIGTVQGDFHDIGKNLVASMLEGGGFEVIDLGVDVSAEKFVAEVKENEKTVIAMSALLTTTMPQMKKVIERLESEGLREKSRVMIGGAPVTEEFAKLIGADGYSENASTAVTLAKSFF
ncbi:MAG: corrinoid protein [Planctomycetaceae bacterium]|nr:corrinoid protein [Planctomycetaceae bacterium]